MNKEIIKDWLNDIATPTGISYSGDRTISESMVEQIVDYVDELEQQVKKQKEVIDKAIEYIESHKYTMKHYEPYGTPIGLPNYEAHNIKGYSQLLDILKEVSE